jgi:hypothetical protein
MRIHEILTESQLAQLDEGPIGSALGAVGRGVGKAVGGVAKGVGAVAGGVRGAFTALKKGYQTGKAVVGDDPDPNAGRPGYTYTPPADQAEPAPPANQTAPAPAPTTNQTAPAPAPSTTTPPSAADINAQGPEGSAPAKQQTGDAGKALAKTTAVVDKTQAQSQEKANQTVYAQVKANVDKLDKKGKQRILQMLQKSMSAPQPAAAKAGAPAPGAGAFGQMAQQLAKGGAAQQPNTMANAPVSATNTAKPGNPNLAQPAAAKPAAAPAGQGAFANVAGQLSKPAGRPQGGGKVAGAPPSTTPGAIKKRATRAAAKQPAAVTASLVHHGKSLNEVLAQRLEIHKRRMFESSLANGTTSVFVK